MDCFLNGRLKLFFRKTVSNLYQRILKTTKNAEKSAYFNPMVPTRGIEPPTH